MKLKTLIEKLEKARANYIKKHGVEPQIWSIGTCHEDEVDLCSGTRKSEDHGGTVANYPYMTVKIRGLGELF